MKIAQVAPLWELVPPRTYGGTELVVHLLTEALVKQGHEVTLFAATGSETAARLVECSPAALRALEENELSEDKTHAGVIAYEADMIAQVIKRANAGEFDVVHNHLGFHMLPFADFCNVPVVTTLHNCLNPPVVKKQYMDNRHLPYVSISKYQQQLWPELNYAANIYHGINLKRFTPCFEQEGKDYLLFIGRLSVEKGPHHAIRIAKALGKKLILAGKIDRVDKVFYEKEIKGQIDGDQIEYVGEVNHEQKVDLMRNALATLCPIEWPEPFGLVLVESMACGTPVIALKDGSIPEVIDHGKTGYVGTSVEELIEATRNAGQFDRREVRRIAEERFSMERMASDHLALYKRLVLQDHAAEDKVTVKDDASTAPFQRLGRSRKAYPMESGSVLLPAGRGIPATGKATLKSDPEPKITIKAVTKATTPSLGVSGSNAQRVTLATDYL